MHGFEGYESILEIDADKDYTLKVSGGLVGVTLKLMERELVAVVEACYTPGMCSLHRLIANTIAKSIEEIVEQLARQDTLRVSPEHNN